MTTTLRRAEIERARGRLAGVARVTPVYRSETLSRLAGRAPEPARARRPRTGERPLGPAPPEGGEIPVGATGIEPTLPTRDEAHCETPMGEMRGWGYTVSRLR